MSNSVWYTEVDTALLKLIQKLYGSMNVYFNPDRDLMENKAVYPCIKVSHLGHSFDFVRSNNEDTPIIVSINKDENSAIITQQAKPYTLKYQIDLLAKKQSQSIGNSLIWFANIKPFFTLNVVDNGGVNRQSFCSCSKAINLEETSKDDERIFRTIITLKIRVEIDEAMQEKVAITTNVNINIKE